MLLSLSTKVWVSSSPCAHLYCQLSTTVEILNFWSRPYPSCKWECYLNPPPLLSMRSSYIEIYANSQSISKSGISPADTLHVGKSPGESHALWLWSGYGTPTGLVGNSGSHIIRGVEEGACHDQETRFKWGHFSPNEEKTYRLYNFFTRVYSSENIWRDEWCIQMCLVHMGLEDITNPCKPDPECGMYIFTCILHALPQKITKR